jgi:hypothetical protein
MSTLNTENFATYLRTRMFWQSRLKNVDILEPIHIPSKELKEVRINALIEAGEIERTKKKTINSYEAFYYKALKAGNINPSLLKPHVGESLDSLTEEMRSYLKRVSLKDSSGSTDYFNVFLLCKNDYVDLFFTVDLFSGRVHTPVSSFHREYRPNILIDGEQTSSLDVATMQPLLLGKILEKQIGINEYSEWINEGLDIYLSIQSKAKLDSRFEAKKRFFQILFSYADKRLAEMFGNANWINWINDYKSMPMEANPHTKEKQHSNLAWLLQTSEVNIMREVWQALFDAKIVFLSVHDEVIVKDIEVQKAAAIFSNILSKHFKFFKLNSKGNAPKIDSLETIKKEPFDLAVLTQNNGIRKQCEQMQLQEAQSQAAPKRIRTISQFHREAMISFDKCLSKDKDKFLICWANDMREILLDNGLSQRDFLNYCSTIT